MMHCAGAFLHEFTREDAVKYGIQYKGEPEKGIDLHSLNAGGLLMYQPMPGILEYTDEQFIKAQQN